MEVEVEEAEEVEVEETEGTEEKEGEGNLPAAVALLLLLLSLLRRDTICFDQEVAQTHCWQSNHWSQPIYIRGCWCCIRWRFVGYLRSTAECS